MDSNALRWYEVVPYKAKKKAEAKPEINQSSLIAFASGEFATLIVCSKNCNLVIKLDEGYLHARLLKLISNILPFVLIDCSNLATIKHFPKKF